MAKKSDDRIFFRRTGKGREDIVFVHGLSGSSSAWLPYERFFGRDYRVLSFDLRGHGKSLKYPGCKDYAISRFAEDMYKLIVKQGIRKFILVSHSFGNLVALEFLKRHHKMVKQIVFLSAGHDPSHAVLARILRPFLWLFSRFDVFPIRKKGWDVDYSRYKNTGDWNLRRMFADVRNTTLRVYLYSTLQSYYVSSYGFLGKITQPVLIIHGSRDTIFNIRQAEDMCRRIPHCRMITIPDADHILVLNHFPIVSSSIQEFIQEV